jgi:hypothetical protein
MSTRSLFSDTGRLDMIKDKIINALPLEMQNVVDFNNIFSDSLFDDLETEYLQDKFIEENMGYVEPLPVKLGTINKQVKKNGQYQLVKVLFHVHPIKNICHFICVLTFFIQTTSFNESKYILLDMVEKLK